MRKSSSLSNLNIPTEFYIHNRAYIYTLKDSEIVCESVYWCPRSVYVTYQHPKAKVSPSDNPYIVLFNVDTNGDEPKIDFAGQLAMTQIEQFHSKRVVLLRPDFYAAKRIFLQFYQDKIEAKNREIAYIQDQLNKISQYAMKAS